MLEYFNSTHGARKGLADTALKTANSGYLDAASGRRGAGLHRHRGGLRHQRRHHGARHSRGGRGDGVARPARARPHHRRERQESVDRQGGHQGRRADRGGGGRGAGGGARARSAHPLGADLRDPQRHLRQVLRARSRPRHAGQSRRGCRRHRRAVDRRARHAAHHAHLPSGRRGVGQGGRSVVARVEFRRHGEDQAAQRRQGFARPPHGHGPQHRRRRARRGRHGAGRAPAALRHASACR